MAPGRNAVTRDKGQWLCAGNRHNALFLLNPLRSDLDFPRSNSASFLLIPSSVAPATPHVIQAVQAHSPPCDAFIGDGAGFRALSLSTPAELDSTRWIRNLSPCAILRVSAHTRCREMEPRHVPVAGACAGILDSPYCVIHSGTKLSCVGRCLTGHHSQATGRIPQSTNKF